MILVTERLSLRPLGIGDVDLLWPDVSDPEISRYMAWEVHTNKSQTVKFLEAEEARRKTDKGITWVIFKDVTFCGIVSLIDLVHRHRALTYNRAELAYWLGQEHRGQGIMTEALRRVIAFSFQELALHKLRVGHFSDNLASKRLIERLGFRYVGEQVAEFQKEGVWHNHKLYEMLNREFPNGQV